MKYAVEKNSLSALADAIREKTGKTDSISLSAMPGEIRGIESGGSLLTDNLVVPPGESLIGNDYTINADGTVTVNTYTYWNRVMMYWADIFDGANHTTFSFLPMENGKTYKLTVTPSEDVGEGVITVNYACFNDDINEEFNVCDIDLKNGNDAIFTVPEEPYYLQFIELPCLVDKSVTYTFDLREVSDAESLYEDGFEAGKKSEYDAFWDNFQDYGNRTAYNNGFYSSGWTDENFKPKYDLIPTILNLMFYGAAIVDLKGCLEKQGVKLDTSQATNFTQMFQTSKVKYIPEIDVRRAGTLSHTFNTSTIISIEKLIVAETTPFTNTTFNGAKNIEKLVVEGTIGSNFVLSATSKLSKESIESIINALSSTATGLTVTLSKVAVNNAFGIDVDDETTWTDEWNTLRNSKSNWSIDMV